MTDIGNLITRVTPSLRVQLPKSQPPLWIGDMLVADSGEEHFTCL